MCNIKFSTEQLQAIDTKGTSLMVSAAAGSGKTAVLVERIIRKIQSGNTDIDKLLVVTFTNAAAAGMKIKIKEAIRAKLKKHPGDKNLKKQLLLVDRANISTVHSFCLDLIKKNIHLLPPEVPGDFTLIDDIEKKLLASQVLSEIMADYYEKNDDDFISLLECYGKGSDDEKIGSLISGLYGFLISIPEYDKWVEKFLYLISGETDFYTSIYADALRKQIENILNSSIYKYEYVLDKMNGDSDSSVFIDLFEAELKAFKEALACDKFEDLLRKMNSIEFAKMPGRTKSVYATLAKNARTLVRDAITGFNGVYTLNIINLNLKDTAISKALKKLFEIVMVFDKRFKAEKYEAGYLDFNDLEHLTIWLLKGEKGLKDEFLELKEKYHEILVDEYQDTNDVQETIFTLLAKDDNLFNVGDVKQSIYRFRNANPNLFIRRLSAYKNLKKGTLINLNANYRCHQNVVDAVNMIFDYIMTADISGVDYKADGRLVAQSEKKDILPEKLSTDIKLVIKRRGEEESDAVKEAKIIASTINSLVADKDIKIDNKPLGYKDITILVRSFGDKTFELLKELANLGVPVSYEDKTQFFDTVEIKSFVSLLKILDNPFDDIAYVATLRNIFRYSEERLLKLRLLDEYASFHQLMRKSENEEDKRVMAYLGKLRKYARMYDLKALITKIYDETFYVEYQTRFLNGAKRQENLERLLDIAAEFEEGEYKGLYSFVNYIERIVNEHTKIANPKISSDSDAVKVMTIHSSKGLEFPVVILQGIHKSFNQESFKSNIILSAEMGIGYEFVNPEGQYRYPSIYKNIIIDEEKTQNTLEEMRVLYVALTRAQHKLIITGCVAETAKAGWYEKYENATLSAPDKISFIDFKNINSFADMILPPVMAKKSISEPVDGDKNEWIKLNGGRINVYIYDEAKFDKKAEEDYTYVPYTLSEEEIKELDSVYDFLYERGGEGIPKKISVTEAKRILNAEEEAHHFSASRSIYVPSFRSESKITARERGILIHYIFENTDLERMRDTENKMEVILDLVSSDEFLKDKLTHDDLKKAEAFFESPLGIKLLRAKEVYREKEFMLLLPSKDIYGEAGDETGIMIQGIIDCYFVDTKGDIYLVDYKYASGDDEQLKKDYRHQLELYKTALSKALKTDKEKIKTYIWNVDKQTSVEL